MTKANKTTRSWGNENRIFNRNLSIIIGVSIIFVTIFAALLTVSGPKIRQVIIDEDRLVDQSNQTIVLRTNQPIRELKESQVSISPTANYSVNTSDDAITIHINYRLHYGTEYSIKITGMTSRSGKKSDWSTTFATRDPYFYYIKRNYEVSSDAYDIGVKNMDFIYRSDHEGNSEEVYSARLILDYKLMNDKLAIHEADEQDQQFISIVDIDSGEKKTLSQPIPNGRLSNLNGSPKSNIIGYTLSANPHRNPEITGFTNTLVLYDIETGERQYVHGFDSERLDVSGWQFAPDGTTILAQTVADGVIMIDMKGKEQPILVGDIIPTNFSSDGSRLLVSNAAGQFFVNDLRNDESLEIQGAVIDNVASTIYEARMLNGQGVLQKNLRQTGEESYEVSISIVRDEGTRLIYSVETTFESILDFKASPNDQYISMFTARVGDGFRYDSYPGNSKPVNGRTQIYDAKGKYVMSIDGFNTQWE